MSDELQARMTAYVNGEIDVATLVEDSHHKTRLLEECDQLKSRLSQANERVQEVEAKWITDKAALDRRLLDLVRERDRMQKEHEAQEGSWMRTMSEWNASRGEMRGVFGRLSRVFQARKTNRPANNNRDWSRKSRSWRRFRRRCRVRGSSSSEFSSSSFVTKATSSWSTSPTANQVSAHAASASSRPSPRERSSAPACATSYWSPGLCHRRATGAAFAASSQ